MKREKKQKSLQQRQQNGPTKDKPTEKLLKSKIFYIVLLGFVLVYVFTDYWVLNLPRNLFLIEWAVALVILSLWMTWRYRLYNDYYKRKLNDKVYWIGLVLGIIVFSFIMRGIVNIPINYLVKAKASDGITEVYDCDITNVVTSNKIDKIHFKFLGRVYSRYLDINNYERRDLIKNYELSIQVRRSIWDTYYMENMTLKKKKTSSIFK